MKNKIKKHLWGWDYSVRDIEGLVDGMDLLVNRKYRVKVVQNNIKEELWNFKENHRDDSKTDSIAVVDKKILYAGGSQKRTKINDKT